MKAEASDADERNEEGQVGPGREDLASLIFMLYCLIFHMNNDARGTVDARSHGGSRRQSRPVVLIAVVDT